MAHYKNRKPKTWRGCCGMCDRGGGRCESVESKREAAVLAEPIADQAAEWFDPWLTEGYPAEDYVCCIDCPVFCSACVVVAPADDDAWEWMAEREPVRFTFADLMR